VLGLILAIGLPCGGCGESGPRRVAIHGTVEQGGSPVASGIVSLLPAEGHSGPAVTAPIEDGRYALDESTGPTPGPHKLVVLLESGGKSAFLGNKSPGPRPASGGAGRFEFRVDVPDRGPFEHNVSLDSQGGG